MHATPDHDLPAAGDRIGDRFHLLQRCEDGPVGWLYDALDEQTGQVVRLRVPRGPVDPIRLGIQHPTLARHLGVADGGDYLVMEDLDGAPLRLSAEGSPLLRLYEAAAQILPLFAELHAHGVVHGTFGLHSLWLDAQGHTRVVDLGIERPDDGGPWGAPERREGGHIDARSDVWALGSVLHAIAAGAIDGPADLPADVLQVLGRARHARPVFRFADAGALWSALQPVVLAALEDSLVTDHPDDCATLDPLAGLPSLPPAPERVHRPTVPRWTLVAGAIALSAAMVLFFATFTAGILSTFFLLA